MQAEKKVFVISGRTIKVYSSYDLKKKWFVYWFEAGKRIRKYGKINKEDTYKGRWFQVQRLIDELSQTLIPLKSTEEILLLNYHKKMEGQWRPSTITNVKSVINAFLEWLNGKKITRAAVEAFFIHLKSIRHATTYNNYRQWLSRIFDDIDRPGYFINVPILKTQKTPARYFQAHQIERLRRTIQQDDPELWLYIQFVYYCFIRPSRELPHITAGQILMEEKEILIYGNRSKNKKTQYVAIPDAFLPSLEFVYDMGAGEYLFPSRIDSSKPIGRNTMYERHRRVLKKLNFGKGYCLYSWKHTGAIAAVKSGVSVKELQLQLRHYSLDETDKYLRQMGIRDVSVFRTNMPDLNKISRK